MSTDFNKMLPRVNIKSQQIFRDKKPESCFSFFFFFFERKIGDLNPVLFFFSKKIGFCIVPKYCQFEPPAKFSEKCGLTGPQLLEGVTFFKGGCNCHIRNKLKSEIFSDKKSL